jgi:autotransporter-associated beta strand protein
MNASAEAGSATWNLNPTSGDWHTAANWTPNSVPNGANDTATFDVSNTTAVSIFSGTEVDGIVFNPGASVYTISTATGLAISGTGVVNNSGMTQNIRVTVTRDGDFGAISFTNNATSGESMNYTAEGGPRDDFLGGDITFHDRSSAGSGVFTTSGGLTVGASGSKIFFLDKSTAAHATFISNGGAVGAAGGGITFENSSSLAESSVVVNGGSVAGAVTGTFTYATTVPLVNVIVTTNGGLDADAGGASSYLNGLRGPSVQGCTFISNGGVASNAGGGFTQFSGAFGTGDSVLIANGGTDGGIGGLLRLTESSVVAGRVEVFGNGMLDISQNGGPGASVGSIEGDGVIDLGALNLTVGSNSLSTAFSGTLQGEAGSSLTKVGTGTLTLSGANTYTDGTTVLNGTLKVNNTAASGTGSGAVRVNAGMIGGRGTIAGEVTVGTGSGAGAFLAPSGESHRPATLTIQNALSFKADATYIYNVNTKKTKADKVIANGVTVESGAQFSFGVVGNRNKKLATGQVFVAMSNTAATQINGTFANLPDGSTFTVGNNTFQASYEGGDGNDLTLTVVP